MVRKQREVIVDVVGSPHPRGDGPLEIPVKVMLDGFSPPAWGWSGGLLKTVPKEHFANHKAGIKAASVVKRYGIRLLPGLFEHLNPMPFEAAAQMEMDLAEDLRRAGYTVTGGH